MTLDRFRPNITVQPDHPGADGQDWIGRTLAFGDAAPAPKVGVEWLTPRCAMVGNDPKTAVRDPALVRKVIKRFGNRVGAYCPVRAPGTIRVGERLR